MTQVAQRTKAARSYEKQTADRRQRQAAGEQPGTIMPDTPGDPGSQLPYQESPPLLPGSYLIGISHFPDPGGFGECPFCPPFPLALLTSARARATSLSHI